MYKTKFMLWVELILLISTNAFNLVNFKIQLFGKDLNA